MILDWLLGLWFRLITKNRPGRSPDIGYMVQRAKIKHTGVKAVSKNAGAKRANPRIKKAKG